MIIYNNNNSTGYYNIVCNCGCSNMHGDNDNCNNADYINCHYEHANNADAGGA